MEPTPPAAELKTCTKCYHERALHEFRRVRKDRPELRSECRRCFNAAQRHYARRKRRARLMSFTRVIAANQKPAGAIEALCKRMIRAFGGLDRLVAIWRREIDIVLAEQPGSSLALQSLAGVLNLLLLAQQVQQAAPASLSDEELKQELVEVVRQMKGRESG